MKLATISSIEGQYFAKDIEGNIRSLHVNDPIYDGEIVFGDSNNNENHSIQVDLLDGVTARITADGEQAFDMTMDATAFGDDEMSFSITDMAALLEAGNEVNIQSDLREAQFQDEILETEAEGEEVLAEETAAGEEETEEEVLDLNFQFLDLNFQFRDGNTVDIISDLRQREFVARTQDYKDEGERFQKESEGRLEANFDRPTFANPTPAPIPNTTPTAELNPPSFGPSPDVPFAPPTPIPTPESTPTPTPQPTPTPASFEATLRLFAIDSDGNEGPVNGANEGEIVSYIVRAFEGDTEIELNGSVVIVFNNSSATGAGTQTIYNGSQDFDNTTQTVTVGEQFTTLLFDDYLLDGGENFTLNIQDESYDGSNDGYSISYDTTPATTTIGDNPGKIGQPINENNIDDPDNGSYDSTDTVYVAIIDDTSVNEGDTSSYTIQLLDKDGNPVIVTQDTDVTVRYTNITTQNGDTEYNNNATITVTIPANSSTNTFDVTTIDDYLLDDGEQFNLEITDVNTTEFENVNIQGYTDTTNTLHVNNVTTTISDAGAGTNKVYAVITDDTSVNEGGTGTYTVHLQDIDGNPVIVTQDTDVTVRYTNITTEDGDTEYNNNATITVTIPANGSSNTFDVDTIDDWFADNGEQFNLEITNVNTTEFEPVNIQGYTDTSNTVHVNNVTTTILDNSNPTGENTPHDPHDIPNHTTEEDKEIVKIKLFAADENGNVITDQSGNYQLANTVAEGVDANYIAYAFENSVNTYNDSTKFGTQTGKVNITFNNASANGVDTTQTTTDGTQDFDNKSQTITIGQSFSTATFNDVLKEGDENYTVTIDNNSYAPETPNSGYESVNIDTTPVTTTIEDSVLPMKVFVRIDPIEDTVNESESLKYKLTIVDENGDEVEVPNGKNIEVTLVYSDNGANPAEPDDYTKDTSVTIVGGTSSTEFELPTSDDYFAEGDEGLKITIGTVTDTNGVFEEIDPHTVGNGAPSDKIEVVGTIKDNPSSDTENPATPSEPTDPSNPGAGESYGTEDTVYVKITNNDSVIEGNDLTHTVTLVDKDGNPITVPNGETITVTITYNPDETVSADFTQAKTITVTIVGGSSSTTITHATVDDFTPEGNESYTATITNVAQVNGTYENVAIANSNAPAIIKDLDSVTGEIIDGVSLGNPADAYVDEDNFDIENGTTTITDTQTLNITAPDGDNGYELLFDGAPTFTSDDGSFNTADGDNLTSNGTNILYDTSTNGVIIGYLDGGNSTDDKVFEITLNKNGVGGANDSYTYTQYKNIDHPISGNGDASDDDDIVLTFGYKITDQGQTSSVEHFTVTVSDSLPTAGAKSITLDEDTTQVIYISDESFAGGDITLNNGDGDTVVANGADINIYDNGTDKNVVGVLTNNGDGTLTFTPTANFSGVTAGFSYGVSDGDGDSATGNVGITVNPIADKPDMNGAGAGTESSTIKTTPQVLEDNNNNAAEEGATDYTATIGLILPQIADNTDETAANSNDDQPEKLGLITLSSATGDTIIANGIEYDLSVDSIKIYITDDPTNYHYNGIDTTGAISLTQAQFEAIEVKFAKDNADNPEFTITVNEYEVNDDNTIDLTVTPVSNSQDYEVDILAVTDPVTLAWNDDPSNLGSFDANTFTFDTVNEGFGTIDLKSLLTKTSGLETDPDPDLDGSEQRSYTISGIPEGTVITLGDRTVVAGSDGTATINFPDNSADDPDFTMTIAEQFSETINGTITLNVTDTDSDSTGAISTETASVNFTMNVNPVADIVTLKVAQAQGFEDAGRTGSNDENVDAHLIDAPENGIELYINVISDDNKDISGAASTDEKEEYNVTIDDIPNGGSMYVWNNDSSEWVLVDNSTDLSTYDDLSLTDNGNGTWQITINDYQNDHLCKFIPPYNSDDNYTFNVSAVSFDNPDTSVAQTFQIDVDVAVDAVADIPVNDELATVNATDDDTDLNPFNLVTTEDSAPINLKNVFLTPNDLDSNDLSTADGSEALTLKVTGLADGFDIHGATFIGGTGEGRIWYVSASDLLADNVTLTTPANFAGQENFQIQFVTTEQAGDSKTHPVKEISVMITPDAEGTVNTTDVQDEDIAKVLDFGFSSPDNDGPSAGQESLESFSIDVTGLEAAGITLVSNGVDLTTGKSGYQTITVTNGVLETVTATLTEDIDTDYSFNISYTYKDVAVDDNGNTYTDTKTVSDQAFNVTVNAITDDINLNMSTSATGANISDDAGHVTVSANGTFTKTLVVTGVDSDGRGNADTDGSEEFTRVTVSGVPEGITIQGGVYAGHTGGGNYSGFWYVNIPNQALDADGATYDLVFDVDGSFSSDDIGDYNITVTAYNQEQNNDVEQSDSQSFTLTIDTEITGPGPGTPALITAFYQDIDQDNNGVNGDHGYAISTTMNTTITDGDAYEGSVAREDTQFQLSDVVHVETDDVNSAFSITLKNVPADVEIEGMTLNANGFYTLSGSGNQQAIIDKLQSILITPKLNANTDASDISNTDLTFDIELTTYASGGASNFALINFSASVLPITDEMDLTIVNDGATDEDVAQAFSITLDNDADGPNTLIIDDRVYLKLVENYSDSQGTDGANGTLYYDGSVITATAVSGVSGISDGDYYIIDHVNYNDTLDFSFLPAQNRDGNVQVDVYVKSQENEIWSTYNTDIITSHKSFSFDVNPVTDGFTLGAGSSISGNEDELVPVVITLENLDSSEALSSVSIGGLPNGFLLFYGESADGSDKTLANNLGNDGTVSMQMIYGTDGVVNTNQWHIPLNGGSLPSHMWIQAPENWSGTIPDLSVMAVDMDGNISPETITAGTITPDVDGLTINPTLSFGNAFEGVGLNLNANMVDLDNSETMTLEIVAKTGSDALTGDAIFRLSDGTVLNATYNAGTYTIEDIPYDQINGIEMVYGSYDGTLTVSTYTKESDDTISNPAITGEFVFKSSLVPGMSVSGSTVSLSGNIGDYEVDFNGNGAAGPVTITIGGSEYVLTGIDTLKFGADEYTLADIFNDTDDNNDLFSGVIIDGIIQGLSYETSSGLSGLTDFEGAFEYREGDSVTFSVGGIVLGTATSEDLAQGIVFLQDLADVSRTDLSDEYVQKMAVFLQSLDTIGTTADGIQIDSSAHTALAGVDLDLSTASMEDVVITLQEAGYEPLDTDAAMEHVKDMLVTHSDLNEEDFDPVEFAGQESAIEAEELLGENIEHEDEITPESLLNEDGPNYDELTIQSETSSEESEEITLEDVIDLPENDEIIDIDQLADLPDEPESSPLESTPSEPVAQNDTYISGEDSTVVVSVDDEIITDGL